MQITKVVISKLNVFRPTLTDADISSDFPLVDLWEILLAVYTRAVYMCIWAHRWSG